jgi:arylsulfatase A-like enzyme/uncharacterized membrane protein
MKITTKHDNVLSSLILLTALFFLTQVSFIVANLLSYLGDRTIDSVQMLHDAFLSPTVLWVLAQVLICQILLYAIWIGMVWYLSVSVSRLFCFKKENAYLCGLLLWLLSMTLVVVANLYYFPRSFFSMLLIENCFDPAFLNIHVKPALQLLAGIFIAVILLSCVESMLCYVQHRCQWRHGVMTSFIILIISALLVSHFQISPQRWTGATEKKPNIIIIGLDALRPDAVNNDQSDTPNINAFLQSSIDFTHAYTPIAQTFPAWISILTAWGPKHNHARHNLVDLSSVYRAETLAKRLQQEGYATIYAVDDSRFNGIDQRFGFDRVIAPKKGLDEFIIGSFNDSLLSNLIVPSVIGRWIFPYNYANHEAIATYEPSNFLHLIKETLHHTEKKPLFLAMHLNIAGWPFGWAQSIHGDKDAWLYRYTENIPILDRQFGELMHVLKSNHLLDNAIVVVLSDHGVTLGIPGDRTANQSLYQGDPEQIKKLDHTEYLNIPELYQKGKYLPGKQTDTSYGYGGDLLGLKQNHVILAFRRYGGHNNISHPIDTPVSLLDVAPTLLDLIDCKPMYHEGLSLKPVVLQQQASFVSLERPFYFETSGASNIGIANETVVRNMLSSNFDDYSFNPKTNMISMTPSAIDNLIQTKQRAVLQGQWLLVDMPGKMVRNTRVHKTTKIVSIKSNVFRQPPYLVLLNLKTQRWTTDLSLPWAKTAPLHQLCRKLQAYYRDELLCVNCCKV